MASGTLSPEPWITILDANGNPVSGGRVYTYLAGTTTLVATYTDVALSVANANPIIADSAGRYVAFLSPGASYKYVVQSADGSALRTQDNISATPASSSNNDVTGVAGENLAASAAVYLSDGSGSKVAGNWYNADSSRIYSSVVPQVGITPAAIASGASGTIRLAGSATGLTSLTVGTSYYIGTAGAVTATAPVLARFLGVADTTSSLVLTANPAKLPQAWTNDFRLTLTAALPVTTADVTAATTIYATPTTGNRIDLPDSSGNPIRHTSAEFSIAVPATTTQMYDIFVYSNNGVATLELLAWTNDTTRATAIIRTTTGRLYKTGDLTRLYVGSFRTTGVSGQTEDSVTKRFLWNHYNRADRKLLKAESTATWAYTTNTWRQANGATTNQVELVVGVADVLTDAQVVAAFANTGAGVLCAVAVGVDSTSSPDGQNEGGYGDSSTIRLTLLAIWKSYLAVGYHKLVWLENSTATGTTTWSSVIGFGGSSVSAIYGRTQG